MRDVLGDDLFIRTARGMEPTVRALGMATQVRSALAQIKAALGVEAFDPGVAQRTFVIAANDYITALLLGRLSQRLRAEAPLVDLVVRPSTRLDLAGQIDVGRIDLAVGIFADLPRRFHSLQVWEQTDVVLLHREHPVADRALTCEDLLTYPEMFDREALNRAFADSAEMPRVRMAVAHSLAIPALLRHSDMLALAPSSLGRELERHGELKMRATPYECSDVAVRAVWHERNDADPALQWLRQQLIDVSRQVRCC
jgi:DNA-binding transcriptional LysR family regulator